jgi:pilus assembly protein TadC
MASSEFLRDSNMANGLATRSTHWSTHWASLRRRAAETSARKLPVRLSFPLVLCILPAFIVLTVVPAIFGALRALP